MMNKLGIKPFSIGFIPLVAFDTKDNKLYLDIKIDKEKTIQEIKEAFSKALPFAVEIGYPNSDTIKFLIGKAGMHEKALSKIEKKEEAPKEEKPSEEKTEEKPEEPKTEETKNE